VDALTAAFVAVEAVADPDGWNQPPVLYAAFDNPLAPGMHAVDLDAALSAPWVWQIPDPRQPGRYVPPALTLDAIAEIIAEDGADPDRRPELAGWLHAAGRSCVAFAFLSHALISQLYPGYQPGDLIAVPAMAEAEARILIAVDTDRRVYQIVRRRGQPTPEVTITTEPTEFVIHSLVVAALTRLTLTARAL